ncbi:hypothetical protein BKA70DRAFT_950 [Coprinopsis sp. MPI-PUGE-AT-0042]|nr:hypothetical protein BKA70DRAFT_950 [Coprinopsis sp. MPI-PUGE-AT-0042]
MSSFVQVGKKIVAIGRNYVAHANELNNAVPKAPFFFLKPTSSYLPSGGQVEIPQGIVAHHEVELAVVISKRGREIKQDEADSYIAGYALSVDMTGRNLQDKVKKAGLPWTAAKGFDTFTPIGPFIPKSSIPDPDNLRITLKINGETKQDGTTADMIFKIPRLLEDTSAVMTLEEGDVILTGTPSGVGPIVPGDSVECTLAHPDGQTISTLNFTAVQRQGGYRFEE